MNQDLYAILGVKRNATNDDIRRSYRKLAKDLHPDQNKGDPKTEEKFKKVSAAFAVLGNPEKRKRYDAGEIDAMGNERAGSHYRDYGGAGGTAGSRGAYNGGFEGFQGGGNSDFSDLFGDLFGKRGPGGAFTMRGMDYRYNLEISFLEAVNGTKKRVQFPDNETLDISVPSGVETGQTLRLKHKGGPGAGRGEPGDALIELKVMPHPLFDRDGDNITLEVPISLERGCTRRARGGSYNWRPRDRGRAERCKQRAGFAPARKGHQEHPDRRAWRSAHHAKNRAPRPDRRRA